MRFVSRVRVIPVVCGMLALPALFPAAAAAQSVAEPNTWTVTPFIGGTMGLDAGDTDAGNSMALGVAVGYDITSNIGVEGELGHLFDTFGDNDAIDWSVTNYSGNFVYHFDVRNVTPYATFGLGVEHSAINSDGEALLGLDDSTEMSFNFGGGVKFPLTRSLFIRGDLRRFESNDNAPDYWRAYAGLTFAFLR